MRLFVLAIGFMVVTLGSAQAPQIRKTELEKLPPILRMSIRAMQNLRYSGTRTVKLLEGANRSQHVEYVLRDGKRMRVWFPNASQFAGQVIVEDGRVRRHYFPGRNEIHVSPPKREEAFGRLINMLRSGGLQLSTEPGQTVAGQRAVAVSIKRGQNVVQKLWIDAKTGMVLKRDLYDLVGGKVGSYEFSDINYSPKFDESDFRLAVANAREVTPVDEARAMAARLGIRLVLIPEPERFVLESARVIKAAKIPILHLAFVRPGTAVSLFQAKGAVDMPLAKRASKGGLHAFSWTMNGNSYALLGNLQEAELRRLAGLMGQR